MSTVDYKPNYLSEEQVKGKALEIIKTLDGIPIGHALHVLESTKACLLDCHLVDSKNDQFNYQASKHEESLISDPESHEMPRI